MRNHLIIHPGTGTIIAADECVILDIGVLSPESFDDDDTIVTLAQQYGSPVIPF